MSIEQKNGNELAAEGHVFVCLACGKRSRDLFGYEKINQSWDESCVLNAREVPESALTIEGDRVTAIKEL